MPRVRSDVHPDARVRFWDENRGEGRVFVRLDDCLLDQPGALCYLVRECGFDLSEAERYVESLELEVM